MTVLSKIISWVLLPLLMPIYALLLVMFVPSSQNEFIYGDNMYIILDANKWIILNWFVVMVAIGPGVSYYLMHKFQMISTIEMDDRRERTAPILVQLFFSITLFVLIYNSVPEGVLPKFVFSLPLSGVVFSLVFLIITQWKKVSAHAGGAGILTGFIFAYVATQSTFEVWVPVLALILSGLVMSARIYLKKHDLFEVLLGWSTATFITFGVNFWY